MSDFLSYSAPTCVFWDVVDCPIPEGHNVREASGNIIKALESSGYNGAVSIRAYYGDMNQTMVDVKEPVKELSCVPAGEDKDLRLEMLLVDFLCWIISHPAPATYMLIVGDISEHKEFIKAFVRFEKQGYTCLLAQPQISSVMKSYGKTNWLWKSLSSGGSPLDEDQSESSQLVDSTSVVWVVEVHKVAVCSQPEVYANKIYGAAKCAGDSEARRF